MRELSDLGDAIAPLTGVTNFGRIVLGRGHAVAG
jgi:hypothetical protein